MEIQSTKPRETPPAGKREVPRRVAQRTTSEAVSSSPQRRRPRVTPCGETRGLQEKKSGSDLLSRAVSRGVPSALEGLTSVFGMGTGGTPPTLPPEKLRQFIRRVCVKPTSTAKSSVPSSGPGAVHSRALARGLDPGLDSRPSPPSSVARSGGGAVKRLR